MTRMGCLANVAAATKAPLELAIKAAEQILSNKGIEALLKSGQ